MSTRSTGLGMLLLAVALLRPAGAPLAADEVPAETVGEAARRARQAIFADRAYRFCHDPRYGERRHFRAHLCALFDAETQDVCPNARAACQNRALDASREPPRIPQPFRMPQSVAQVLVGIGVAAILVLFLRALGKLKVGQPLGSNAPKPLDSPQLTGELPEMLAKVLLREARRALEASEDSRAAVLLHLALLRHLDDVGKIRFHPSKTNGEYVKRLRGEPEMQGIFRASARQTERLRFGDGQVEGTSVAQVLFKAENAVADHSTPRKSRSAIEIALLVALGGTIDGCLPEESAPAYRLHKPSGLAALPELLEESGLNVTLVPTLTMALQGVVVLRTWRLPERIERGQIDLGVLLELGQNVVLIDDAWRASQMLPVVAVLGPGGADRILPSKRGDADRCATQLNPVLTLLEQQPVLVPRARRLQPSAVAEHSDLMGAYARGASLFGARGADPMALYVHRYAGPDEDPMEKGCLYLFSDRDLFTNASLTRSANAMLVAELFSELAGEDGLVVLVDPAESAEAALDSDQGSRGPKPQQVLRSSKMLPFILQAFLLLLVFFSFVGSAFGPLRDQRSARRKRFVEHVDALGRLYAQAGEAGRAHAARTLARWLVHKYRDRVRSGDWRRLAEELAAERGLNAAEVEAAFALGHGTGRNKPMTPELVSTLSTLVAAPPRRT